MGDKLEERFDNLVDSYGKWLDQKGKLTFKQKVECFLVGSGSIGFPLFLRSEEARVAAENMRKRASRIVASPLEKANLNHRQKWSVQIGYAAKKKINEIESNGIAANGMRDLYETEKDIFIAGGYK